MQTYAKYVRSYSSYHRDFTWISLSDAVYEQDTPMAGTGSHRAKADCIACARHIHQLIAKRRVVKEDAKNMG
ncbi:hypothetical protein [Paenibacillus sp. FSL L8-0638]|uniref:hypothetical protein n=1 Tax=Paenibacillus sp. FSL L8-0638 TaxID=2921604 RepID=UPI0031594757